MIKQDYLIRMIQEIISLIVNAILNKKKFRKDEWTEYDCQSRHILIHLPLLKKNPFYSFLLLCVFYTL